MIKRCNTQCRFTRVNAVSDLSMKAEHGQYRRGLSCNEDGFSTNSSELRSLRSVLPLFLDATIAKRNPFDLFYTGRAFF
jgi:hypothetical protein